MKQCATIDLLSYSTGICSDSVKSTVESHLAECESCRTKLDALRSERDAFLAAVPFEELDFTPKQAAIKRFPPFSKAVSSVAALLVVGLIVGKVTFTQPSETAGVALKGATGFQIMAENSDGTINERRTPIFYPDERIQICYTVTEPSYVTIFSVDSSGAVSRYFPADANQSAPVAPGVNVPIPNSVRLDNYIGSETYCMVVTKAPISVDSVAAVIAQSIVSHSVEGIDLPAGDTLLVYTTEKKVRK